MGSERQSVVAASTFYWALTFRSQQFAISPEPCGRSSMSLCCSRTIVPFTLQQLAFSLYFERPHFALALAPQHPQLALLHSSFGNSGSLFCSCVSAARLSPAQLFCLISSFPCLFRSRVPFLFRSRVRCQSSHMLACQLSALATATRVLRWQGRLQLQRHSATTHQQQQLLLAHALRSAVSVQRSAFSV